MVGRSGEHGVGEHTPVGSDIIRSFLYLFQPAQRYVEKFHHVAAQMQLLGLFTEDISHTWHAVAQRKGFYRKAGGFEHNLPFVGPHHIELKLIGTFTTEKVHDAAEHLHTLGKCMHGDRATLLLQRQGGKQTGQTETMVAMQMAYENVVEA